MPFENGFTDSLSSLLYGNSEYGPKFLSEPILIFNANVYEIMYTSTWSQKFNLNIGRFRNYVTFLTYLRYLNSISCMIIFIAIDHVDC